MARPSQRLYTVVLISLGVVVGLFGWADTLAGQRPIERHSLTGGQPQLLEHALAQVEATSGDQSQIYFVGFAGYGHQAVFKREVVAVRQLLRDRFGTTGRSVALINHPSTADEFPLATVANLGRVLKHVGGVMDTSRDTLFLFLTSHGEKGMMAVQMPGVATRQLTPQQLKTMLDRSGIKRRVIVISSCHSGSFIPVLAGPTTLVITAARADRSSFGCEDRRRWTYFGDAYFNHALREERSFRRAFNKAKRLITLWEARDRLTRSLPQIAGGEALTDID